MGLLADVETCSKLDARPLALATSLTAQGTDMFASVPAPISTLRKQLRALKETSSFSVAKSGVLPTPRTLKLFSSQFKQWKTLWVVDPIVQSSSGNRLSTLTSRHFLELASSQVVLTPNVLELSWLVRGRLEVVDRAVAITFAKSLIQRGFYGVVVKGGHFKEECEDFVCTAQGIQFLRRGTRFVRHPSHRGTGCRFSTALAVGLARGLSLYESAHLARITVRKFLRRPILEASLRKGS